MTALLLALLVGAPGHARPAERAPALRQVSVAVESSLAETTIAAGSTVVLQLRIRTGGLRPQIEPVNGLPDGLEVVKTSSSDQRQFSLPGGTTRFVSRDYVLLARRPGRYRIPPLSVVVGEHRYRTNPLLLTVEEGSGGPAPDDEVTLRAWLNTDTAYVGQQVTFRAEATFGDQVRLRLRRAPEYFAPNPSGFWVQELPGSPTSSSRVIGASIYQVQTFQRALFAVSAGRQVIPPARLSYEVRRGLMNAPETRDLLSDTLHILVLPVPAAGRPADFTGAVGRYSISARLEPDRLNAGEAAVLSVTVEGRGNLKALPAPALPPLDGVQLFPPTEDASVNVVDGVVRGSKRFEWVLIAERAGTLDIPSIRYPFFDPWQKRFMVASAAPLSLAVQPGAATNGSASSPDADLRYLKMEPAPPSLRWTLTPWFAALQLAPILALLGLFLVRRRRDPERRPGRRAVSHRRRQLVESLRAPARMQDPSFFRELDRGVRAWLAERLERRVNGAPETFVATLLEAGVAEDAARGLADLLARLERAAYEPVPPSSESRRLFLQAAERLLESVDRQAPRSARNGAPSTVTAALLALALAGPAALRAQTPAPPVASFENGVAAFQANAIERAVADFRRYTTARPADPAGWYDLGNAYEAAGERGQAIRAWLEALARAPRDPDVLNNLRVARADPALVDRVRPLPPLAPQESALLASLFWLLGGTALFLYFRRRRAYLITLAAVLVTAAALVGGVAAAHAMRPRLAVVTGPDAALRATPNLRGDPLVALGPGDGLRIVERRGGWWRVRTLEGRDGWVEAAMLTRLGQ